jgi:anti-sigma B factor antagonist
MDAIQLHVQKAQDAYHATVVIGGEVDLVNAGRIDPGLILNGMERGATVHIDLTGVTFIDSTGITRLLNLHRVAEERGIRTACYVREEGIVHRVMRLIGVTDLVTVIPVPLHEQAPPFSTGPEM